MTRKTSGRSRLFAIGAASVAVAVVATLLTTQLPHPSAAATPANAPSPGEAAAGVLALSQSYPGGLPALLRLFDTGECAGIQSYDTAPPACRSILDQVAQLGSGHPAPAQIPDVAGDTSTPPPPAVSPDPSDRITPEMVDEMEAQGFPADLIAGLRQNPPVIPPQYDTWLNYQGGPAAGDPAPTLTTRTSTTLPTDPPPTTTTDSTTTPTTITVPTTTSTTTTVPTTTTSPTTTTPTTTSPTTTTTTTTTTTPPTTTTTTSAPPPPPPPPPLLVAVGDSVTSGHEARPPNFGLIWRTTCDDLAAGGSSWADNLRVLIGVPGNRYFNFAHSGSSTTDVLTTVPYTNPCGVASQPVVPQIGDATAVLRRWPSQPGKANVAVATAGVNDTNWVGVATTLVRGRAPAWATANPGSCTDWALGNPRGNPAAPPGPVPPAWNGVAVSAGIALGAANIALQLIGADPGAQVRHLLYYRWVGDPNLPANCNPAAIRATSLMNGWITVGILIAQIIWAIVGGNPNRIQAVCEQLWIPGPNFVQTRLISFGIPNRALVPGWPHPNAAGRASLGACVNGTLPRAPGGGGIA